MSADEAGRQLLEPSRLSKDELDEAIAELETERELLEARRVVIRRRIALLRAERLARTRNAHFDAEAVAEAVLRRLPGLVRPS